MVDNPVPPKKGWKRWLTLGGPLAAVVLDTLAETAVVPHALIQVARVLLAAARAV